MNGLESLPQHAALTSNGLANHVVANVNNVSNVRCSRPRPSLLV